MGGALVHGSGAMKPHALSFLAGLAVAALGLLLMGQSRPAPVSSPGRYQIVANASGGLVLDTQTGMVKAIRNLGPTIGSANFDASEVWYAADVGKPFDALVPNGLTVPPNR